MSWEMLFALSHRAPRKEVDLALAVQKQRDHTVNHVEGNTIFRGLMLSTFMSSEPSEPAPSAHAGASVGAIVEIIVGAIVGAVICAVVVLTLTTIHHPRNATLETSILS